MPMSLIHASLSSGLKSSDPTPEVARRGEWEVHVPLEVLAVRYMATLRMGTIGDSALVRKEGTNETRSAMDRQHLQLASDNGFLTKRFVCKALCHNSPRAGL